MQGWRHGEEWGSGGQRRKTNGLVRLELARPLSCSTIRSRTLSLIASIYTASRAATYKEMGGCQEVPSI